MANVHTYDVVVVGSGLGGLVSAVILAKEGLKVCVLEKNNQFGGNLQTFSRDKKIFDTGVHYIGGLDKGQNLYRYFTYVGIMDQLKIEKMPTIVDRIMFHNTPGEFPIAQGYENFIKELSLLFPTETHVLAQYVDDLQKICDGFALYNLSDDLNYPDDVFTLSLRDYLDSLTDNALLKSVLIGNSFLYAIHKDTPFYIHALSINSYLMSAYRCVNGASQISKLLVRELRKLGGEALKHQEVCGYQVTAGRIESVHTVDGSRFFAETFISNIDPATTLRQVGKEYFRKAYYDRIQHRPMSISSFSGHYIVQPGSVPYVEANVFYHRGIGSVWSSSSYVEQEWPETVMISMTEDKERPGYADTISGLTYMHFDEVAQWSDSHNTVVKKGIRGEDYELFKAKKLSKMLAKIEEVLPHLSGKVKQSYASTPLTYRDYIGSNKGNLYGPFKVASDPMGTLMSPKTKIPNLYMTGQGVNMHGVLGVTIGAVAACSELLGKPYLIRKIAYETGG